MFGYNYEMDTTVSIEECVCGEAHDDIDASVEYDRVSGGYNEGVMFYICPTTGERVEREYWDSDF